ncbi:MAG: mevalonate kinase [Polyangiaceae bacterium]
MARANGKVILCGEHAVVYGVPAIAAAIDRGAEAVAELTPTPSFSIGEREFSPDSDVGLAFARLRQSLGAPPCRVHVRLEIPAGAGLGASAAIAVASARAVLDAQEDGDDREGRVLAAAQEFESVFHGTPSGIDTAAAACEGCIWFVKGHPPEPLRIATPLSLAVGIAGPPASTKQMVDSVRALKLRRPELVDKTLAGIEALTKNARLCLEAGDVQGLGKLLDLNQMLLAGLHVSTTEIEEACALARGAGALGSKLTGAGGGGAVIALVEHDPSAVLDAWRGKNIDGFAARVGVSRA